MKSSSMASRSRLRSKFAFTAKKFQRFDTSRLPNQVVLEIEAPIKVCGKRDIHGQYSDLLWLLEYGGFPPKARYLFIGNYVDYGMQGIETICLLLAYNIKCPKDFFILRGNHECANVGRRYGFYDECKRRYNVRAAASIACLLLLLLMGRFCVHGGLSPDLENLDQIRNIRRPTGVSDASLLCHLLWSDPCRDVKGWGMNDRGVSCTFGVEKIEEFLMKLDLDLICRSQKVVEGGYEFFADKKMVTVFSAPNFRGKTGNAGAVSPSIA